MLTDPRSKNIEQWIFIYSRNLPKRMEFYNVDGQTVFPLRSQSGGLSGDLICYLIRRPLNPLRGKHYKYGIRFTNETLNSREAICLEIENGIERFIKYLKSPKKFIKRFEADMNGGNLGTGDNV